MAEAASHVDLPALMLGAIENGVSVPGREDLENLLGLYRVPDAESNLARTLLNDISPTKAVDKLAMPRMPGTKTRHPLASSSVIVAQMSQLRGTAVRPT